MSLVIMTAQQNFFNFLKDSKIWRVPITFVFHVRIGSSNDSFIIACAARWKTKSGWCSIKHFSIKSLSKRLIRLSDMFVETLEAVKFDGDVFGSRDIPVTFAPVSYTHLTLPTNREV